VRILSWNTQFGKSSTGTFDFNLTLDYTRSLGEFDVICLQELARYMKEYCIPGQDDHLQLGKQFYPDYTPVWGSGFSWKSISNNRRNRREFGNLTLIKNDLLDYKVHQLPLPATPGKKQMQRIAVETVVDSKIGPLSIINTHLAYHDSNETIQQLEHLHRLEQERAAHHRSPKQLDTGAYQEGFLSSARILCGDFNFTPDTSHYKYQIDSNWIDAWRHCAGDEVRLPTCGIFDSKQWPEGAHSRDYFWLSKELRDCELTYQVDTSTDLSDHQPIMLELAI
jgi:endonuclease/exonuclease/phosphatase family metal-dependent hydrolase